MGGYFEILQQLTEGPQAQNNGDVHGGFEKIRETSLTRSTTMAGRSKQIRGAASPMLPKGDYSSPGLDVVLPDEAFPNLIVGAKESNQWPYLRREVGHNWYVDRRNPTVGFASRDEALILYNLARRFEGLPCLEIGCWRGWSTVHLALGSGNLEVIDPILADPEFRQDVMESLKRAGVLDRVALHVGRSPEAVERISAATGKRWSLVFIDGDHEADAPRLDAEVVHRYAARDATIVLHDLTSPYVAAALDWLRANHWETYIYQTMQIIGVAVRGSTKPIDHVPDPTQHWTLPSHLVSFPVIGETRSRRLNRILAGLEHQVPATTIQSTESLFDSLPPGEAAAFDALLTRAASGSQKGDDLAHAFDDLQKRHIALLARLQEMEAKASLQDEFDDLQRKQLKLLDGIADFETTRNRLLGELDEARQAAIRATAERQDALREFDVLARLFDRLQGKHLDLLRRTGDIEGSSQQMQRQYEHMVQRSAEVDGALETVPRSFTSAADGSLRRAIRDSAYWIARKRILFGLVRRLILGRQEEVRGAVEQMLRDHGVPGNLVPSAMWLAKPRVVFGLARRRALAGMQSVQGLVVIALESHLDFALRPCGASQPLSAGTSADTGELQRLRETLEVLQRRFTALEAAKVADEKALLEADLIIARLRGTQKAHSSC
jgi:predicted O-methyltransferase YrrM